MRGRAVPSIVSAALLAWTSLGASAPTEPPPRAALRLPECTTEPEALRGLRAALALELRSQRIALDDPLAPLPNGDALNVSVAMPCDAASSTVELRVSYKSQQHLRQVSLTDVPDAARARALALSAAELIALVIDARDEEPTPSAAFPQEASTTAEPTPSEEPKPAKPPATAAVPKRRASTRRSKPRPESNTTPEASATEASATQATASGTRLALAPEGRWFDGGSALWGGRAELAWNRFVFGASLLGGGASVPSGEISALLLHAVTGYRALEWQLGRHGSFAVGPRLGLGLLRASGTPNEKVNGGSIIETYADAAVFGSAELRIHRAVRVGATVEAGYAHGVIGFANGEPVAYYGGGMAGAFVGVGLEL